MAGPAMGHAGDSRGASAASPTGWQAPILVDGRMPAFTWRKRGAGEHAQQQHAL